MANSLEEVTQPLNQKEKRLLQQYESDIREGAAEARNGFRKMAEAFHQIKTMRLYREHGTFASYFQATFGYGRSHANRVADAGGILALMSPRGDILEKLNSESHFRPLTTLRETPEKIGETFDVLERWSGWTEKKDIPAEEVRGARAFVVPVTVKKNAMGETRLAEKFLGLLENAESQFPPNTPPEVQRLFQQLKAKASAMAIRRSTGISWATDTWNPLAGCSRASEGCDRCYAAQFMATRAADLFPGVATKKGDKYRFTGKITLLPERLGEPLVKSVPSRIFVNSLSDLFHKNVPDDFISEVFTIMEKACWHQFQVLTKRPERMAAFTRKRYERTAPPTHIWLGTSTENQAAYDNRIKHLQEVKAAIRWISCEPLLGPIHLGASPGIDWCVVGGESHGGRPMKKEWAVDLRDQCKVAKIPFHFKQWGDHNEFGEREKEAKEVAALLDGVAHLDYPLHKIAKGRF